MAATLAQIAALANTHRSTVSLVLNGRQLHRVSEATRQKIERIAKELDYRVNRHAQSLIRGQTRTVALLLNQLTNPFFGQYVSMLETRFEAVGYHVSPFETRADTGRELELMSLYSQGVCDIIVSLAHYRAAFDKEVKDSPVVVRINDYLGLASQRCLLSHVAVNYRPAMTQLVTHLGEAGYRQMGLVLHKNNEPFPPRSSESDYDALLRELLTAGPLTCGPRQQIAVHEREPLQAWYDATRALLTRDPTIDVLLVHTMDQVVPVIEAATRMGRVMGKDLGIATFDGPPIAEWLYGGITVVHEPAQQVADALAELVIARLDGNKECMSRRVEAAMVPRASTCGRRH